MQDSSISRCPPPVKIEPLTVRPEDNSSHCTESNANNPCDMTRAVSDFKNVDPQKANQRTYTPLEVPSLLELADNPDSNTELLNEDYIISILEEFILDPDFDAFKKIVDRTDIFAVDKKGKNLLYYALAHNDKPKKEYLINKITTTPNLLNKTDNNGDTALKIVLEAKCTSSIIELSQAGATFISSAYDDVTGRNIIHLATVFYDASVLEEILISLGVERTEQLINVKDSQQNTPIHLALNERETDATKMKVLRKYGAQIISTTENNKLLIAKELDEIDEMISFMEHGGKLCTNNEENARLLIECVLKKKR